MPFDPQDTDGLATPTPAPPYASPPPAPAAASRGGLFDKRFVIVAGKGGVGKSTLAAAIGFAAARRGLRTLIVELNTVEKVPHFFGVPPGGYATRQLADNLYSANIQPEPAMREYGLMKLRYQFAYNVVFENDFMRKLLRLLPGMNELLLIGKAWYEEDRVDDRGRPVWDMVIVDAPATGHGVSLFRLPHVILSVVQSGPLADDTQKIRQLLLDPERTAFNIVTLAEEMPVAETLDLMEQNRSVLQIPPGFLFVNQVWPPGPGPESRAVIDAYRGAQPQPPALAASALAASRYADLRRDMQQQHLARIDRDVRWPRVDIPYLFPPLRADGAEAPDFFDASAIERIADCVEEGVEEGVAAADGAARSGPQE